MTGQPGQHFNYMNMMSAKPVLTSLQRVFMSLQLSKRSSLSPRQFLDILHPPWFDAVSSSPSSYTPWRRGIEEDIDKTITDVQRENCAGDDGRKTLLADNQGSHGSGVNSGGEAVRFHGHSLVQAVFGGQLVTSYHYSAVTPH